MRRLFLASSAALLALAGCSTAIVPEAAPPAPVRVPSPTPAPAPVPAAGPDWRDWAVTPGNWSYRQDQRGSIALYGQAGAEAELTLRCDRAQGRLVLSRSGDGPVTLTVRTSTTRKSLSALPTGGMPAYAAAELAARDPLIDAIGFSRGRFIVETPGSAPLVLPAWPEILRVAEDCRG